MRTLGIDLAAQPKKTGVSVTEWPDDASDDIRITLPTVGFNDAQLLGLMGEADVVAIDAPFGWPEFISEHLRGYARDGVWPLRPDAHDVDEWTGRLLYRETDRAVRRLLLGRTPPVKITALSVSSDRIAVCAWRCAALLNQYTARGSFDRTGERSRLYEAYPAAALASWGLPFKGYKPGSGGSTKSQNAKDKREQIVTALEGQAPWLDYDRHVGLRDALVRSDDALDAFISTLVARAAATGNTVLPAQEDERRLAPSEGWIHVPTPGSLRRLARAVG